MTSAATGFVTGWRPDALSTRALTALTALGATVGLGMLVPMAGRPWYVLLALAAVAAVLVSAWRLEIGLCAFVLATALNRYNFDVAGWQMKIEHVVLLLVLAAWSLRFLSRQERLERWPLMALIAGFLGVGVLASTANSPDLYKSMRILTRMSLAVVAYLLIVNHVSDRERLWRLATVLLAVIAGAALYGIIASAVWRTMGANIGLQYSAISGTWYPYGTLWEANIFGAYVMSGCVASLVLLLSGQRTINRWFLSMVFVLTAVAMLLSLARGAWVGFGVSLFFVLLFMGKLRFRNLALVLVGCALALLLLTRANPGGTFHDVWDRFGTLSTASQDINAISRLSNSELALREWRQSRWLGKGVDGFHINHPEIRSGLPSPQINALYDTGLLGVTLFVVFTLAIIGRAFAAVLSAGDQRETPLLLALLFSFLGLLVAYQATDALWLGFTWVHLSLLMAATLLIESQGARSRLRAPPVASAARGGSR